MHQFYSLGGSALLMRMITNAFIHHGGNRQRQLNNRQNANLHQGTRACEWAERITEPNGAERSGAGRKRGERERSGERLSKIGFSAERQIGRSRSAHIVL